MSVDLTGRSIASYRITAKLGEGGMGEVWRATDTKLDREVAIKVLPAAFTEDPERLARFEREAKVLAQLHHPNIASIFGLEDSGGVRALVMELVEGPTLAERLEQGAIPLAESLSIARQIAEALEEAHAKGIVHRDLKPQNIKASIEGKTKVLDFGLAKAMDPSGGIPGSASQLAASPTLTLGATVQGMILGTAAYMAPEQAKGFTVDKRADIWAFGVVLFEMLSGRSLFAGDSVPDTLARVLQREIGFESLPESTPPAIRRLLRRCLERNPKNRLHDIADARIVLDEIASGEREGLESALPAEAAAGSAAGTPLARAVPWLLSAVLLATTGWLATRPAPAGRDQIAATIAAPTGTSFYLTDRAPGGAALSPDGAQLAFAAIGADSVIRLYVREMATGEMRTLAGAEGAQYPFWSPDGGWIAYFSQGDGLLRKIPAHGGAPLTICRARNGKGGSWNEEGTILFAPGPSGPIYRVDADGGEPTPVTVLDKERFNSHRHPRFLPDGRHFLFFARAPVSAEGAVMVGSLETAAAKELMAASTQAESGGRHLLYVRDGNLLAQGFDPDSLALEGSPASIASGVAVAPGAAIALFTVSNTGLLAVHRGSPSRPVRLELRELSGAESLAIGSAADGFRDMTFAPDGQRVAFVRSRGLGDDLFVVDLESGTETRMTVSSAEDIRPVWSPDGRSLFFSSNRDGPHDLYRLRVDGSGSEELVLDAPVGAYALAISPDGRSLLYALDADSGFDLWSLDLEGGKTGRFTDLFSSGAAASFSPDGRWVTLDALTDRGREIFAVPFPGPGRPIQVSTNGGQLPNWLSDTGEIFFGQPDGQLIAVPAKTVGDSLELGSPRTLPWTVVSLPESRSFGVSPDGRRLVTAPDGAIGADNELQLLVGWDARLEARR